MDNHKNDARRDPPPPSHGTDLSALFNLAAQALASNRSSLNEADTENQNHGDNMVQVFNTISQAMAARRGSAPSNQLQYASEVLAQNATSGSANVYAQGLAQAADKFQGQSAVTPDNAMMLIQSLLSGGQPAQSIGSGQPQGLDLGDIINAGMSFMNAKQQGQSNMQAALTALMSSGPMAQKPHRQQSGQLVANTLLQAITGMAGRK
ncbi:MAG: hypothetical protein ACM3PS_16225 [Syntrophothermus sp.]